LLTHQTQTLALSVHVSKNSPCQHSAKTLEPNFPNSINFPEKLTEGSNCNQHKNQIPFPKFR
jgi:hypothetical protein